MLTELWEARRGGQLLHAAYDTMQGAQGAIARRAEEEFGRLTALEQGALRRMFGRLVRPGEGTDDTRRRATIAEVGEAAWPLVRRLADARLLVTAREPATGDETVEVSHEALIRKWDRLGSWLGEDREFLLWRQRLGTALAERKRLPDDPGTLLRGARLTEAARWLRERPQDLTEEERRFISDSVTQRETDQEEQRRHRRNVQLGLTVGLVLAVLASSAVFFWRVARKQAISFLAQKLAVQALLFQDSQPELALLLAAEGASREPTPETTGALLSVIQRHSLSLPARLSPGDALRGALGTRSESASVATVADDGWVVDDEGQPFPDAGNQAKGRAVATSPAGNTLAIGHDDGTITLWDVATRSPLGGPLLGHDAPVTALAFASDGTKLVSGDEEGTVLRWTVGVEAWTERACRMAGHESEKDVLKYLGGASRTSGCTDLPAASVEGQPQANPVPDDMVRVPAGWFLMGCNDEVEGCEVGETGRRVYVDAFAIDQTEVTVAQYRACRKTGGCTGKPATGRFCTYTAEGRDQHPINCVDWFQAKTYCAWAGKRLPGEGEWEKAARGTDGRKYPWGKDEFGEASKRWANIADEDGKREVPEIPNIAEGYDDGYATTAPVGSFPDGASPYGARDMAGNVWEWVWDKATGGRGVRGGSWAHLPEFARVSLRSSQDPQDRRVDVGFRCAK